MSNLATKYEQDFYQWALHNAQLLREGKLAEADVTHIAEELESMGNRDKRELISRLAVLLAHLLKWQFQPKRRSKSWELTIIEQRNEIKLVLEDSPSLKYQIDEKIAKAYQHAVVLATKETGLQQVTFPTICPYSLEQVLDDEEFYPE